MAALPVLESTRRELRAHTRAVSSLAWSPSGRKLASGGADDAVRTWAIDAARGGGGGSGGAEKPEVAMAGQGGAVRAVAWHPQRDDSLASVTDKYLRIWDMRAASKPTHAVALPGASSHAAWHPDGHTVAVASYGRNEVVFADARKGAILGTVSFSDKAHIYPGPIAFLGNGSAALVGCDHGVVSVVRLKPGMRGGDEVATLTGHVSDVLALALSPDQRHMATGATDALVTLWDTDSATPLATVSCLEYAVTGVSFSADGARVAISQERGPVVIARAPDGRPEGVVPIAASHCVVWHPKVPHLLAYGSDDAGVWNAEGRRTEAGGPIGLAFFGSGGGGGRR